MAMEGIPSKGIVSPATLKQGEAPVHTHPDHRGCAYYVTTTYLQDGESTDMQCPHGAIASGAFYSEDRVRDLELELRETR